MSFPTFKEIESWSNDQLLSVIEACNKLNWDISLKEPQEEIDDYIIHLLSEKNIETFKIILNYE